MTVKPHSPPFAPLADESVTVIVSRLVDQLCALATAAGLEPRHMVIGFTASDPADPDIHHSDVMTSGSESADMTRMLCENLMDLATYPTRAAAPHQLTRPILNCMECMMTNRLPHLGDEVCHKITGFRGIVTTHATHLTGCDRLWIEPRVDATGKMMDGGWADIDMVEITRPDVIEVVKYTRRAPGGVDLPPSR